MTLAREVTLTAVALALSAIGCSASGSGDVPADPGPQPAPTTPPAGTIAGCTRAPACGSCGTCAERCFCERQDTALCASECATIGQPPPPMPTSTSEPVPSTDPPPMPPPTSTSTETPPVEPPPPAYETVTISTVQFQVPPGGEVFRCQNFKNPLGKDIGIVESESFMAPGSHHMFLFREPSIVADSNAVEACSGVEFRDYVHLAQRPNVKWTYPPGVARLLKANDGLRVAVHYVNTSSETLTGQVSVTLAYDDPSAFQFLAAPIFLNNAFLAVPPGQSTASREFPVPYPIRMLRVVGHMHSRGVHLGVKTNTGIDIYQTDDWDEPDERVFDTPLDIPGGSTITWSCDYENPTGNIFTFGESANTNEMCISYGLFYPTAPGANQGVSLGGLL